jgi:hypothetical protein
MRTRPVAHGFAARSISHRFPRARFFTILPAQAGLGNIGKAESADDISEKISVGFVEGGVCRGRSR